jgi:hypothetical protein
MIKTGRLVAGESPDELTGEVSTEISEGRAVASGATKAAAYLEIPRRVKLDEE